MGRARVSSSGNRREAADQWDRADSLAEPCGHTMSASAVWDWPFGYLTTARPLTRPVAEDLLTAARVPAHVPLAE
jgi:hypothetical protein